MTNSGVLSVEIISDSIFFGVEVPVEVRDSQMRLVKRSNYERRFELPSGLYEVSAVLEDGRKHRQLVQIKEQQEATARLALDDPAQAPPGATKSEPADLPSYERPRYTQKVETFADASIETNSGLTADLLEVQGAALTRQTRTVWMFESREALVSVPSALIQINDQKVRISLPISPEREFPFNSCVVKIEETRSGAHLNAWISRERTVANALQNMLSSGYVLNAADVASQAVDLLRYKYADPTGAALGALILSKAGLLEKWASWMENLGRDFAWLPDGNVLLARLLFNQAGGRARALQLAIQASRQRMLYSESFSLLLDLLRRWPRDFDLPERQEAAARLASQAASIDWESICFNETVPE